MKYKPHIDGLRAVAVLLVIFHHLGNWAGTHGGYVGVDVFFVISGYLITCIVKSELEAGRFTFSGFYRRRIVRLAPAYFTVLLATTLAALVWLLPTELLAYARSMAASSVFLANVHMWKEVGGYFGADANTVPLRHLWSLAVEEQFYLFWPFALLIAHRFVPRRWLPWLVVSVAVGGTFFSQWGVSRFPAAAYYLLPTRVFELAVGGMLAYLPRKELGKQQATIISLAGLTLIAYAALAYSKETRFPGYTAMVPVLGTAILLHWGEGTWVGRALSTRGATLVGKISYPAYLWHWPIIAFLHVNQIAVTFPVGLIVLFMTLVLSWFTYQYVELPARRFLTLPARKVVVAGGGLPIAIAIAGSILLVHLNGLPGRFSETVNRKDVAMHAASLARGACHAGPPDAPLPPESCVLGRHGGKVNFLLVGDSHANHFSGFWDVLGSDARKRGYDITGINSAFFPGVQFRHPIEPEYNRNFLRRNEYVSQLLARTQYDVIVLAGDYEGIFNGAKIHSGGMEPAEAFKFGFRSALSQASAAASRVIVMNSIPILEGDLSHCGLHNSQFGREADCSHPTTQHKAHTAQLREALSDLRREFPDVIWIETDTLLCDESVCVTEMDGIPLYKDYGHLNDVGSRILAKKWIAKFGNPLMAGGSEGLRTRTTDRSILRPPENTGQSRFSSKRLLLDRTRTPGPHDVPQTVRAPPEITLDVPWTLKR